MQPEGQWRFGGAKDFYRCHGGHAARRKTTRTRKRGDLRCAPPGFRPGGEFRRPGRRTTGKQAHCQALHAARKGKCGKPRCGDQRNGAANGQCQRRQNAGLAPDPV